MVPVPIRDWGEAITTSMAQALSLLLAAIPRIIGFLVIVAIGWFIATLIARAVATLLRSIRFNDMAERSGFAGFVANTGVETDSSGFVADIAKWFVRLITLVVGFDALGLPAVSDVLRQLLLWLPNLAVAIAVLVLGGLAANWLAGLVRGAAAKADLGNPDLLADHRPRRGVGVRDRGGPQPDRHRPRPGEHAVHGHRRRGGAGPRPGVRHRRTRHRRRGGAQLVRAAAAASPPRPGRRPSRCAATPALTAAGCCHPGRGRPSRESRDPGSGVETTGA